MINQNNAHVYSSQLQLIWNGQSIDLLFHLWMVHLPELVGIESYTVKIECSFTVKQVLAYGIDITPRTGLYFEIADLVDKKRFYSPQVPAVPNFPLQANPATLPSGAQLPVDPTVRCAVRTYVQIPAEKVVEEARSDIKTTLTSFWTKAFDESSFKDDFTMTIGTQNQLSTNDGAGYINAQAQENIFNYYYITLKNFFTGIEANTLGSFSNSAFRPIDTYSILPSNTADTFQLLQISRKASSTTNFDTTTWRDTFFAQASYSNYDAAVNKVISKDSFVPLNTDATPGWLYIGRQDARDGVYMSNCMSEKVNPTTKCGYVSGALMSQSSLNFGDSFTWGQYSYYASELCQSGDECSDIVVGLYQALK